MIGAIEYTSISMDICKKDKICKYIYKSKNNITEKNESKI